MRQAQQQIDLRGQLRENEIVVPFRLIQRGPTVRYIFSNPDETLQLQIGEKDSRLEEVSPAGAEKISPAQFDRKVRGTNLTYEDLALKFLYWPNAKVVGEENIRTRNCWKLELHPPSRDSQYGVVWLWIDKESGALMRMEGYDWGGKLAKRFEVISAQKIDNRWFLKQMRIEEFQPGLSCLAAPVRSRSGAVVGSVAISLNSVEFGHRRATLEPAVRHGAMTVTRALQGFG